MMSRTTMPDANGTTGSTNGTFRFLFLRREREKKEKGTAMKKR